MKNIFLTLISLSVFFSCAGPIGGGAGGELTGNKGRVWNEPAPYGMVLVKRGSINMGASSPDSLWDDQQTAKGVSVDAFWMDEKEVSNAQYRQFVYWVRDSIIRERLADPAYGGNEIYKIEEDKYGDPIKPYLNWSKAIPWKRATEDEARAIESLYITNPITGERMLDASQLNYRYEVFDYTGYALRKNRLDASRRVYDTDVVVDPNEQILISKDTAFIDEDGKIVNATIVRPLSGIYDFLHTRIVNIYPDTTVWVNDFANAYNDTYSRLYFSHPGYNDYPVVGVSWEQANAFCDWRTEYLKKSYGMRSGTHFEAFRLPTEAEWEYAARAGKSENSFPWDGELPRSEKGCFNGNFKPEQGNFTKDGFLITAPVGSYKANDFGLYDMAGNVTEWTSTAWSEAGNRITSDVNPEYKYDAAKEDPYRMKRKVTRGGSWKDVGHYVRSDVRSWDYQNEQRSFIGFRCVRTYMGFGKSATNMRTGQSKK
ncbi:MAG: SUMF1/EgtB/PvdO family nonheme iron enzyme [Bacteroidales bacterium]|nr:SUMF1/EgtB/PvdO family nonheme iron enzyme [Bacteroidales bacterium]